MKVWKEEVRNLVPRDVELKPVQVIPFLPSKDKRVYGLYLHTDNLNAALMDVIRKFNEHGIKIVSLTFPSPAGSVHSGFMVIDVTKSNISIGTLLRELRSISSLKRVSLEAPNIVGVLADFKHFPLVEGGRRVILYSENALRGYLVTFGRKMGDGLAALNFHAGVSMGEEVVDRYVEWGATDLKKLIEMLCARLQILGWCRMKIKKYKVSRDNVGEIVLRVDDHWECVTYARAGLRGPAAHTLRGVITGMISKYLRRPLEYVSVSEVKCIALGSPHCEVRVLLL